MKYTIIRCIFYQFCNRCDKQKQKKNYFLTSLQITVTPFLFFAVALCVSCQDLFQGWLMEWPEYNRRRRIVFFSEDISFLTRKWEFSFSPPLSGVPHLCGSVRLLLIDWNLLGNKGPQCAGKGSTWGGAMWMEAVGWVRGVVHCSPGAFVSDTVPLWGLMRTNWSECNKWIIELNKRLYFVGCTCRDPPIICPLSWAHWLASAWSGSLNISLSLSCLFYYVSACSAALWI